ncbi:hypothetical protein B0T22DRAFT_516074 [Podospora appendiculata]|uniref:Uncharacterized protein n=1 Tax=Podospora appendiculata TaxID=314037 RepID=A0AAE0XDK0_9PEZI|nr:hypothetical protein B0T22DRAFT_516074 [Podospora appendiculata]
MDITSSRLKKVAPATTAGPGNLSQVVTYSTRIVDKISDVVRSMNISPVSCIKSGTVESLGNSLVVDEAKFATGDVNIGVSVRVTNHMSTSSSDAKFIPPQADEMDSKKFLETYGDCYVSGFVTGGDLHGLVSIKALDPSRRDRIVAMLNPQPNGLSVFDPEAEHAEYSFLARGSETGIAVHWSGGGKIKLDTEKWSLKKLLRVAAAFPTRAAKANIKVPRFDALQPFPVMQYTYDLLDDYMHHKANLRRLQATIANPNDYERGPGKDPFDVNLKSLLEQQSLIKEQMSKISSVVTALNLHPTHAPDTELKPPELWTARLPTSREGESAMDVDMDAEDAEEPPQKSTTESEQESLTLASGSGLSPTPPSLPAFVNSRRNRLKYQNYRFEYAVNGPNDSAGDAFNDAITLERWSSRSPASWWPRRLEIYMDPSSAAGKPHHRQEIQTVELSYHDPGLFLHHGRHSRFRSRVRIAMELAPGERINVVQIGKCNEHLSAGGVVFFEASTTDGKCIRVGKVPNEGCEMIKSYYPPDEFTGLKGFWGAVDVGSCASLPLFRGKSEGVGGM